MACLRNEGCANCANCGRRRYNRYGGARRRMANTGPGGLPAAAAAAAAVANDDRVCGQGAPDCTLTPAQELYGASCSGTLQRRCCDLYGCRNYPAADRNPFWPDFAHPRWLPCEVLYHRFD